MQTYTPITIANFFVVGVNHYNADAMARGLFAINIHQYDELLKLAPSVGIDSVFILSTCNRTEIYGFAESDVQLIKLLCRQTKGSEEAFKKLAYVKQGADAAEHLLNVGAGLDSQILGDYEIIGQLKQAVKFAKERNFINCFLERLVNNALQSSKKIKNETALSSGSVSVSFAAMQFIKQNIKVTKHTKILLIGTGKIGRSACKHIVDYLGTANITLINRSIEKASELASELNLKHAPYSELAKQLKSANIILAATSAGEPTILKRHLENNGDKLIIDLSIPHNVEPGADELPGITIVNIDALSDLKYQTLQNREAEIPKAQFIIKEQMIEFMEWYNMRKNAAALNAVKIKLIEINQQTQLFVANGTIDPKDKIQTILKVMANKLRYENQGGCHYIEAINQFMDNRIFLT